MKNEKDNSKKELEGMDVISFPKEDYMPLKDYESWRVAVLKSCENTRLSRIMSMQKHLETDEVFVLLHGAVTLILAGNGSTPKEFKTVEMKPHRLYNIKKGFWHNHVLDDAGEVLIVENRDTTDENSPIHFLTEEEITQVRLLFEKEKEK